MAERKRSILTHLIAQDALNQRRHEETVQVFRNLERKLDRLANTGYTVTVSPKGKHLEQRMELPRGRRVHRRRRESSLPPCSPHPFSPLSSAAAAASSSKTEYLLWTERRTGQSVSAVSPSDAPGVVVVRPEDDETPPRFRLPQSVRTVMQLWRSLDARAISNAVHPEYRRALGVLGGERGPTDRQYISTRRRIFDEIVLDWERGRISWMSFLRLRRRNGAIAQAERDVIWLRWGRASLRDTQPR